MHRPIAVLLALWALPASVTAQHALFLHTGPSAPIGDLARGWDTGYNLGGGVSVPVDGSRWLRLEISWDRLGVDPRGLFEDYTGVEAEEAEALEGGAFSALTALVSLEWGLGRMAGVTTPYLTGGLGYALLTHEGGALLIDGERVAVEENRDNGLAAAAGAGVRIDVLEAMAVFSEARLMAAWSFDDRVDLFFPLRLGVSYRP